MKARVLIVDDEPIWQEIIRADLVKAGYSVRVADDYQAAELALQKDVFHLAIIDIRLDSVDTGTATGMALLERIVELETELPYCIVLTGYPTVERIRDSFKKYHVWDFVEKTHYNHNIFIKKVNEAITQAVNKDASRGLESRWQDFRVALQTTSSNSAIEATSELIAYISKSLNLPAPQPSLQRSRRWLISRLETQAIFANMGMSYPTLLLAFHGYKLSSSDLDNLRDILAQTLSRPTQVAFFLADEDKKEAALLLLDRVRQIYSCDIIILRRQDIKHVLIAQDPPGKFRQLVFSQISLTAVSPFVITGPTSHQMFFGREHELREITVHAAQTNYALIGGRRIGKSSILKRLERVRLPAAGFRALYHDCSYTPTQEELVQALLLERSWFPQSPANPPTSFFGVIQSLPDDKPLVILFDEADKLIKPDKATGYRLFNTLRALANADRCRFVLSGEQTLHTELTNPNSPLYNFANDMLIGCLDFHAVEELVTRPMKQLEIELANETEMVQRIWDLTSGHPNVVQRLCQRLIIRLNQRQDRHLTLYDVEAVVADPDFLRKGFLNIYWERATVLERLCSLVMAADDAEALPSEVSTLMAVHQTLTSRGVEVTLNQVNDALERLVDLRNILLRTFSGYEFAVTAFPEVIAQTARLDDLIALNCETYQHDGDAVSY